MYLLTANRKKTFQTRGGGGGSYFPHISQLAKRTARVLPADLCTDHAHYVKNHRSTVLRKNKNMAVECGAVSHYYILVRELSEISRGRGVETEGGSQLFETAEKEGVMNNGPLKGGGSCKYVSVIM